MHLDITCIIALNLSWKGHKTNIMFTTPQNVPTDWIVKTRKIASFASASLKMYLEILLQKRRKEYYEITWLCETVYRKTPKNLDTGKIAVIILKFEQCGSTIQYCVQKMHTEWQTV